MVHPCRGAHRLRRGSHREQSAAQRQKQTTSAVGEKANITDARKPRGQHMLEKAAQELLMGQRHRTVLAAMGIIFPAKSDLLVRHVEQTRIRDRHPMRVAGQVLQDMLWSTEGLLGIDHHPVFPEQSPQEGGKRFSMRERLTSAKEAQLVPAKELLQARHELAPEDAVNIFLSIELTKDVSY
jgi:hypothetical protein